MTVSTFAEDSIDCSDARGSDLLLERLAQAGIATFTGIDTRKELVALARRLGTLYHHRDADPDGITVVAPKMETSSLGYQGFTSNALTLHTDSSGEHLPPNFMLFYCLKPAEQGGESLVLDGQKLYRLLRLENPTMLEALSMPNSAFFGNPQKTIPLSGEIFSELSENRVSIRFRFDKLSYYAPSVIGYFPVFLEKLTQWSKTFKLQEKQGYILQNDRWLHGRTPFVGERKAYRILINANGNGAAGAQWLPGFEV